LSLPSEAYLTEISDVADVDAIHTAREFARRELASRLFEPLYQRYMTYRETSRQTPYLASAEHFARRALQNIALAYLMFSERSDILSLCLDQFDNADNMTELLSALASLINSPFDEVSAEAL